MPKGNPRAAQAGAVRTDVKRHHSMTWAKHLKRVFAIDIERCRRCGGKLRVIASIEDKTVIERILDHLDTQADSLDLARPSRAPPQGRLPI